VKDIGEFTALDHGEDVIRVSWYRLHCHRLEGALDLNYFYPRRRRSNTLIKGDGVNLPWKERPDIPEQSLRIFLVERPAHVLVFDHPFLAAATAATALAALAKASSRGLLLFHFLRGGINLGLHRNMTKIGKIGEMEDPKSSGHRVICVAFHASGEAKLLTRLDGALLLLVALLLLRLEPQRRALLFNFSPLFLQEGHCPRAMWMRRVVVMFLVRRMRAILTYPPLAYCYFITYCRVVERVRQGLLHSGGERAGNRVGNRVGKGSEVGLLLGDADGEAEGEDDGLVEGEPEGLLEGDDDGLAEGDAEGSSVGLLLGEADGVVEGEDDGLFEGDDDGLAEGDAEGEALLLGNADGVADGEAVGLLDGLDDGLRLGDDDGRAEKESEGGVEGEREGASVSAVGAQVPPTCEGELVGEEEGCWVGSKVEGATEADTEGVTVKLRLGEVDGLLEGDNDGLVEGEAEGNFVGLLLGEADGEAEGVRDGLEEGDTEGVTVGLRLGELEGVDDGLVEREAEGTTVRLLLGEADGLAEGVRDGDVVGA